MAALAIEISGDRAVCVALALRRMWAGPDDCRARAWRYLKDLVR